MYKKFYKILLGYMWGGWYLKIIGLIEDIYALVAEGPGFNYQGLIAMYWVCNLARVTSTAFP